MEMHLEAVRDIDFTVAGESFSIAGGETIHTENSLKYASRDARTLLRAGRWSPIAEWTDPKGLFALLLLTEFWRRLSQIDDDVAARLRAANENVAISGLVEWLRPISDGS
jgi:hypothetical protein